MTFKKIAVRLPSSSSASSASIATGREYTLKKNPKKVADDDAYVQKDEDEPDVLRRSQRLPVLKEKVKVDDDEQDKDADQQIDKRSNLFPHEGKKVHVCLIQRIEQHEKKNERKQKHIVRKEIH